MSLASPAVDHDEIAVLRILALEGGLDGEVKVSCAGLADRMDVSNQTVSRRLQQLEDAGVVERELATDGQWIVVTEVGEHALRTEYETYRRIFEDQQTVRLTGTATDGMGEGRHYISLEGYRVQFLERLGYEPFPGTLNVSLDEESARRRARVESLDAIPIDGWEDADRTYGPAVCYPVSVHNDRGEQYDSAHAIVPERTHHDADNLELIAPDKLRDVLELEDDAPLEVILTGGEWS